MATNDVHYILKEDSEVQRVLIAVQTSHTVEDNTLEFQTDEFYLKTEEEMASVFEAVPQAVSITEKIAQMCNVEFEFGHTKLPHFEVPNGMDHFEYFKTRCENGLSEKFSGAAVPDEYRDRLSYELKTIKEMGYVDYFLIVHDFIEYARSKDIPVGPGRGSGAGSLAAYAIGITGIDPIKYNLLFERFLNPERVSMPDFDIDFCYVRRGEVIDYVNNKYGKDHVAQIVTFGTMAARGAIRDVGRALGMSYSAVDKVAKMVPFELHMTIDKALQTPALKDEYLSNPDVKRLIDTAKKVEGMPKNTSTHAAGVVITREPVNELVPLAKNDDLIVTQYTMTTLEELGLLKMDFLGLRTLTVISDAERFIKKRIPSFDIKKISLSEPKVFEMMSTGQTLGVFQFESAGMRRVLTNLKPTVFEDLIAVISLYRPGPMDSIPKYIENRHNPSLIEYKTPLLKRYLTLLMDALFIRNRSWRYSVRWPDIRMVEQILCDGQCQRKRSM